MNMKPINQTKLFGLDKFILEFICLFRDNKLPNKILLSGEKGLGKCTLAYHLINFILSENEEHNYNIDNFEINPENQSFKTILNASNPNLRLIDVTFEKKYIDIDQIRELIQNLNKSSLNNKPRFILIDNIEFLNVNSINALLKVLEEPSYNVYFILINNNKKILPTLLSRCINFRVHLNRFEKIAILEKILNTNFNNIVNEDLINYYFTPGNFLRLIKFSEDYNYDLKDLKLKNFLKIIFQNNHYKKDDLSRHIIFDFIEFYLSKIDGSIPSSLQEKYSYFLKRISNTKNFNLDDEVLFLEFENKILNG